MAVALIGEGVTVFVLRDVTVSCFEALAEEDTERERLSRVEALELGVSVHCTVSEGMPGLCVSSVDGESKEEGEEKAVMDA